MNGLAQLVLTHRHMVTQKWPPKKDTTTDTHGLEWNLFVYF